MVDIRCLRAWMTRVSAESTPEIFFSYVSTLKSTEKKIGARATPGTLSSSTTFNRRYSKIQKIQNFEIGIWLVWGRDIDPRWSPGCRGMVSAPRDRFPDVQPVKTCTTSFFGNRKVALCKFEFRRFGWCRRLRNTTKDSLRSSGLFSKTRDRTILTYLSQKVVEGYTHESKDQRLEGKERQDSKERAASAMAFGASMPCTAGSSKIVDL